MLPFSQIMQSFFIGSTLVSVKGQLGSISNMTFVTSRLLCNCCYSEKYTDDCNNLLLIRDAELDTQTNIENVCVDLKYNYIPHNCAPTSRQYITARDQTMWQYF